MVIWCADLHLTYGSEGISRVWTTRGWHLCISEDLFTLSNVDGFPADPDMEVYDQTSVLLVFDKPPLADTEMLLVKHMIKTLVPPVCCRWCHQRLDPAMHHSHSVWQAGQIKKCAFMQTEDKKDLIVFDADLPMLWSNQQEESGELECISGTRQVVHCCNPWRREGGSSRRRSRVGSVLQGAVARKHL